MRKARFVKTVSLVGLFVCFISGYSFGQLYSESFDTNVSADWNVNPGANDFNLSDFGGDGLPDFTVDHFFDYSLVGIPSAPNSTGGSTRGLKIQANLVDNEFGGGSTSPTGQAFTGDYSLKFDLWGNYVGDPGINPLTQQVKGVSTGGSGQTNVSTYGIMTDGETVVSPGLGDGVWFAATVDGESGADYRAYSIERNISYQFPFGTDPDAPDLDLNGDPIDGHATYYAESRNNSAPLYSDNFGGATPPAAQAALFPQQVNSTPAGSLGMEWHEVEIKKSGNVVSWLVDGVLLVDVDTTNFTEEPLGENIFFGHSDINSGSSGEPDRFDLQFTLIDNVVVSELGVSGVACDTNADNVCDQVDLDEFYALAGGVGGGAGSSLDYDGDGSVGNGDLPSWLAEAGTVNGLSKTHKIGDVNLDGNVDSTDLGLLLNNFGANGGTPAAGPGWGGGDLDVSGTVDSTDLGLMLNNFGFSSAASAAAVPEPSAMSLVLVSLLGMLAVSRRRR